MDVGAWMMVGAAIMHPITPQFRERVEGRSGSGDSDVRT